MGQARRQCEQRLWCVAFLLAGAVIGVACGSAVLIVASVSGNT